jgi:hypothetical protein
MTQYGKDCLPLKYSDTLVQVQLDFLFSWPEISVILAMDFVYAIFADLLGPRSCVCVTRDRNLKEGAATASHFAGFVALAAWLHSPAGAMEG